MRPKRTYRVIDPHNGYDLEILGTSVGNVAAKARRLIASQQGPRFVPWQTDATTGGWKGVGIDCPSAVHVHVERPNPRPERQDLPWKRKQAA